MNNKILKEERLKSTKEIDLLFNQGERKIIHPFKFYYFLKPADCSKVKFGVGVNAKKIKLAVQRNKTKRIIRESYRIQQNLLKEKLQTNNHSISLFILYQSSIIPDFQETKTKILKFINFL